MRFLSALQTGVTLERVAYDFVQELMRTSARAGELCCDFAAEFVSETLSAIGFMCHITAKQIEAGGSAYEWPANQLRIYSFHYNELSFSRFERFLVLMGSMVQQQQEIFLTKLTEDEADLEDEESPVELLMQLIAVWCNVYKHLQRLEQHNSIKRFEEPLSRINFNLLKGVHRLRKKHRLQLPLLDNICNRLYWSALQGLFYRQAHVAIAQGLMEIFECDFEWFHQHNESTLDFYYEAFSVEHQKPTSIKLCKSLELMLNGLQAEHEDDHNVPRVCTSNKLLILTNFLIEQHMLEVYYTFLRTEKTKTLLLATLSFLKTLQSKLLSLDCFTQDFIESILALVFRLDVDTSTKAAELYVIMMQRKVKDQIIFMHILEFYVARMSSNELLKHYVNALYKYFPPMKRLNNYLEIITNNQTHELIRLLSSHMFVVIYNKKLEEPGQVAMKRELQQILQIFPELLDGLTCQKTIGILLQIFLKHDLKTLPDQISENFIHYALGVLSQIDNSFEYPLLMNIFAILHECLLHTCQWHHLELLASHISTQFYKIQKSLNMIEGLKKSADLTLMYKYRNILQRLSIILKTKYDIFEILPQVLEALTQQILHKHYFQTFITKTHSFIDIYALEIVASCLQKMLAKPEEMRQELVLDYAQQLVKYLLLQIRDIPGLSKLPVVRVKTYFNTLIFLYCTFPLELQVRLYHIFVQILIVFNFETKSFNLHEGDELQHLHPQICHQYQKMMLREFTKMHACAHVKITTKVVWKLCIFYELPPNKFNAELKYLLITLAHHQLKIYKHIIAVLLYNLHRRQPALKDTVILNALIQHKHLIENEISIENPELLKVHIVLLVLQMLEKSLNVQKISTNGNRLETLKHLYIFVEDLDLNALDTLQLIVEQVAKLKVHLLNECERNYLTEFSKHFKENK